MGTPEDDIVRDVLIRYVVNAAFWGAVLVGLVWLCGCLSLEPDEVGVSTSYGQSETHVDPFHADADAWGAELWAMWRLKPVQTETTIVNELLDTRQWQMEGTPPVVIHDDHAQDESTADQLTKGLDAVDRASDSTKMFLIAIVAIVAAFAGFWWLNRIRNGRHKKPRGGD